MPDKNLYEILGVRPDASQAEIRTAYLKLAKQWHPDRNTGNEVDAERRFKEIAYAYGVLSNSDKRAAYDASSQQWSGFDSTIDEADAFDLFISVLLDLAFELAENGADQITIYQALTDMGCPSGTAKTLAQKAHKLGSNIKAHASRGGSTKTNNAAAQDDKNDCELPSGDVEIAPANKSEGRWWALWLIPLALLVAILFGDFLGKYQTPKVEAADAALPVIQDDDANSTQEAGITGLDLIEAYTQVRSGTAPTPILQSAFVFDGMSADDTGMITYNYTIAVEFTQSIDTSEFDSWVIGELSKGFCGIDMLRGLSRLKPQSKIQVSIKTWNGRNYGSYKTFTIDKCP